MAIKLLQGWVCEWVVCPSPPTRIEEAKDILSIAMPIEETFQLDCLTLLANVRGVGAGGEGGLEGLQPPPPPPQYPD